MLTETKAAWQFDEILQAKMQLEKYLKEYVNPFATYPLYLPLWSYST